LSRIPAAALALGLYLLLAFGLFSSAWRDPSYLSIGAAGDAQLYMWMLGWVPYSISHGLNPFFTNYLIYPLGANLLWSLIPIVPGLVLSPPMVLLGPVASFNLVMTLGLATSAWCAYLAVNSLVGNRLGAFIGGLVFGFSPYMLAHSLGHPNLVICATPALVLLILTELFVRQRLRAWQGGLALGLLVAAQLLTTPEILFTTVFVAVLGTALIAALRWRDVAPRLGHAITGLVVAAAVSIPLAAFPLAFLFFGPLPVHGVVREQDIYVTDVLNFLVPTQVMLIAPQGALHLVRQWTGDDAEWNAYIGVPLAALLLYVALRWRHSTLILWSALLAVVVAVLSLGPHLHTAGSIHFHVPLPWLVFQRLPIFDNVLPARLMLYFYLMAAVAIAFFVRELRRSRGWVRIAGWTWIGASLVLLLPAVPWLTTPNPIPAFFSGPGAQRIPAGSVALVAPFSTAPGFQEGPGQNSATYPLLWQLSTGMRFRMPEGPLNVPDINGRPSGGRPAASTTQSTMIAIQQGRPTPEFTPVLRDQITADLRHWQVRTVVIGPMYNQEAMVRFFSDLLGSSPEHIDGVYVWWDVRA
jgi:hypothetical protein